jgi:uncharacterized protein YdaU (DUF1376 family)
VVAFPDDPPEAEHDKARGVWWWVDRWRRSTAWTDMTLEEQGAYRNLLDEVWVRADGVIPEASLARACGDPVAWPRLSPTVLRWMRQVPGGWTNDTALQVKGDTAALRAKRRAAGLRGYEQVKRAETGKFTGKTGKPTGNGTGNATGNTDGQTTASPSPSPDSEKIPPTPLAEKEPEQKPERKVGPQEQAARLLRTKTGGSLRVCRDQVASLIASGWTIERVTAAVHVHANAHVNPWEWKKKALAVVYAPGDHNAEARAFLARAGDGKRVAL